MHPSPAVQKAEQKSRAENHTSSPPESSPRSDSKLQVRDSPKRTPAWPYRASPSSKPFVFITTKGTRRLWGPAAPATHRQMVLGTRRVPPTSWDPACAGETHVLHPGACSALTTGANTTPRSAPRQNARCWPPLVLFGCHPPLPNARPHKPPRTLGASVTREGDSSPASASFPSLRSCPSPAAPQSQGPAGFHLSGHTGPSTRRATACFGLCGRAKRGEGRAGGVRGLGRGWYLRGAPRGERSAPSTCSPRLGEAEARGEQGRGLPRRVPTER